ELVLDAELGRSISLLDLDSEGAKSVSSLVKVGAATGFEGEVMEARRPSAERKIETGRLAAGEEDRRVVARDLDDSEELLVKAEARVDFVAGSEGDMRQPTDDHLP